MPVSAKPWKKNIPPKKILAIRMHATGDVIITLPYLQNLRNNLSENTIIDFLTLEESAAIPANIILFNKIYSIRGGRNFKNQIFYAALMLPKLFFQRYDVILDIQNNEISNGLIKILRPKAWTIFDKTSPIAAGERTRQTIEAAGFCKISAATNFCLKNNFAVENLLKVNGKKDAFEIVILNPAGAFETRNWPIQNYVSFAKLWLQKFPKTQFLIMGIHPAVAIKAGYLKKELQQSLIDLVNKTTPEEAFAILQNVKLVLSEDSGLMHMAWVSGIPTLALFGSTRSDWSRPLGKHSLLLDSSDLPCGNCMLEKCKYADTHCLTRYSAEFVLEKAITLLNVSKAE